MIRQQGCSFKYVGIELDGQEFIDCHFEQCRVIYRGGPLPRFGGKNQFVGCQILFLDAAGATMEMLKLFARNGNTEMVRQIFESLMGSMN